MKKWQIVLTHLLVQLTVGGFIVYQATEEFTGPMGGIGVIITYLCTAGGFLALSLLLTLITKDKNTRSAFFTSMLFTLMLWIMAPLLVSGVSSVTMDIENSRLEREANEKSKTLGMQVITRLGLRNCTWDDTLHQYRMPLENGRSCSFLSNGELVWISDRIKPLGGDDSVGWARLALEYVRPFIQPRLTAQFDSLIQACNIKYERYGNADPGQLRIGIFSPAYVNVGKYIDAWFYPQDLRNFNVRVPINMPLIRPEERPSNLQGF